MWYAGVCPSVHQIGTDCLGLYYNATPESGMKPQNCEREPWKKLWKVRVLHVRPGFMVPSVKEECSMDAASSAASLSLAEGRASCSSASQQTVGSALLPVCQEGMWSLYLLHTAQ